MDLNPDPREYIADYQLMRAEMVALTISLGGRVVAEGIVDEAALDLGLLDDERLDAAFESDLVVLMEHAIFGVRDAEGHNAVDRMLAEQPPAEGSPQLRLLQALPGVQFAIVTVKEILPGVGLVCRDLQEQRRLVIDKALSLNAQSGTTLAMRILSPAQGWWMTVGAVIPISDQFLPEILEAIEEERSAAGEAWTDRREASLVLGMCIQEGVVEDVTYRAPGELGALEAPGPLDSRLLSTAPIIAGQKVARNDPCPCGSGKKYKKCCGA